MEAGPVLDDFNFNEERDRNGQQRWISPLNDNRNLSGCPLPPTLCVVAFCVLWPQPNLQFHAAACMFCVSERKQTEPADTNIKYKITYHGKIVYRS